MQNKMPTTGSSLRKMRWLLFLMGLVKIPLIGFVRPKLLAIDGQSVRVRIKLRRRTRNHLGSMYFGALAVGADVAGGIHAFYFAKMAGSKVSFAFKSMQAEFIQRAESHTVFESQDGPIVKAAIAESRSTGERVNKPVKVSALNRAGEEVAVFTLVISVKVR